MNDSLSCDFPVFILKLFYCKQVEFSPAFFAAFTNFGLNKWYFKIGFSIEFNFHLHYIIKFISKSFIIFIPRHLLWLNFINMLNGVDDFDYEIENTTEFHGYLGCNATKLLSVFSSWEFLGSPFWKGPYQISTVCCFGILSIIESSGEDNSTSIFYMLDEFSCCIVLCSFLSCSIKTTLLSVIAFSAVFLKYFWSDSKEEFSSRSFTNMNISLRFYSVVFIFKLSGCNIVDLYAAFLAALTDFFVSINDTVQSDFQLTFHFHFYHIIPFIFHHT